MGALKGVGEKAMEALVAEREANGPFKTLDDFAERIDPRLLNRRQIESLAAAGAFDSVAPDRAAVFAAAETILAHAASAAEQRTSGQHGLFGGEPLRTSRRSASPRSSNGRWRSAWRPSAMPSASISRPTRSIRSGILLAAHKAKTFAELADMPMPAEGRAGAIMAALVEDVALAGVGEGPPLPDGDAQRFVGPV